MSSLFAVVLLPFNITLWLYNLKVMLQIAGVL
jgi:hypothetical protein